MKQLLLLLAIGTLSACANRDAAPKGVRVALITPGSIADAAWNSGAYRGLQAIRDSLGLEVSHVEARTPAEQEEALRTYAAQGYALVFAHGYEFQQPAERVSGEYPKTYFVVTSGARVQGNVSPMIFRLEEASYLAGMVGGALTKSNKLGFVGGVKLPPVVAAYQGWVNGARAVNPKVDTREVYLNNWDDAAAGKEAALALISQGVDVFHHNADAAALGVFAAAKERGALVFGANADQSALAPDQVPGSAVIDLPHAFLLVARELAAGSFAPRVIAFGVKDEVVRYVPNPAFASRLPAGLEARVVAARDSIAEGTLKAAERPAEMQARSSSGARPRRAATGPSTTDDTVRDGPFSSRPTKHITDSSEGDRKRSELSVLIREIRGEWTDSYLTRGYMRDA